MQTKSTSAKYYLIVFIAPLLILTSCNSPYEHSNYQPDSIDVSKIRFARNMYKLVQMDVVEKNAIRDGDLPNLKITDSIPNLWRNRFPPEVIEKN